MLASESGATDVRAGLAIYTSSRAAFGDLTKMLGFLRARAALAAFNTALSLKITTFDDERLAKVQGLLDAVKAENADAIPFALTMVAIQTLPRSVGRERYLGTFSPTSNTSRRTRVACKGFIFSND